MLLLVGDFFTIQGKSNINLATCLVCLKAGWLISKLHLLLLWQGCAEIRWCLGQMLSCNVCPCQILVFGMWKCRHSKTTCPDLCHKNFTSSENYEEKKSCMCLISCYTIIARRLNIIKCMYYTRAQSFAIAILVRKNVKKIQKER